MTASHLLVMVAVAMGCAQKPADSGSGLRDTSTEDRDGDGVAAPDDCDDADATVYPGAEEVCDGVDQDCDGAVDEDLEVSAWFADADGDGHAGTALGEACGPPEPGAATEATDCDDGDPDVSPSATEVCNDADDDCDGLLDEVDGSWDPGSGTAWYWDFDGDGYGAGEPFAWCDPLESRVANDDDCDDGDPAVSPAAPELCNYADDDCDGVIDPEGTCDWTWAETVAQAVWYPETARQYAGYSVDAPGDFNLDGQTDLVIASAIVDSPPYASAWITDGYGSGEQPLNVASTLASFEVSVPKIDLETSLGCDLDDDGMLDAAFGAVQGYLDPAWRHGIVYVVYSPLGSHVLDTDADAWLVGRPGTSSSGFGGGLACGDVDLDGGTELLVGSYLSDPGGAVFVFDGELSGELVPEDHGWSLRSEHLGAGAGHDVVVGDLTGDGVPDVAIGAKYLSTVALFEGGVYIVEGPVVSDMSLDDADSLLVGPWYGDYAGSDIDLLSDQDGDGISDLVIGSYQTPYAYVINGPGPPGTSQLEEADAVLENISTFNSDAVTGGDFNGDGFTDVVVGHNSWVEDPWVGAIKILWGPLAGTVTMSVTGDELRAPVYNDLYTGFGRSVTTADVDGDGLDDLWTGATSYSKHLEYTGAGYLFLGSSL